VRDERAEREPQNERRQSDRGRGRERTCTRVRWAQRAKGPTAAIARNVNARWIVLHDKLCDHDFCTRTRTADDQEGYGIG
jgi:hypothetical protein